MFPGHPYLRQEQRRAENKGETLERERVVRLIDARLNRLRPEYTRLQKEEDWDGAVPVAGKIDELNLLRRAVQQGHQR